VSDPRTARDMLQALLEGIASTGVTYSINGEDQQAVGTLSFVSAGVLTFSQVLNVLDVPTSAPYSDDDGDLVELLASLFVVGETAAQNSDELKQLLYERQYPGYKIVDTHNEPKLFMLPVQRDPHEFTAQTGKPDGTSSVFPVYFELKGTGSDFHSLLQCTRRVWSSVCAYGLFRRHYAVAPAGKGTWWITVATNDHDAATAEKRALYFMRVHSGDVMRIVDAVHQFGFHNRDHFYNSNAYEVSCALAAVGVSWHHCRVNLRSASSSRVYEVTLDGSGRELLTSEDALRLMLKLNPDRVRYTREATNLERVAQQYQARGIAFYAIASLNWPEDVVDGPHVNFFGEPDDAAALGVDSGVALLLRERVRKHVSDQANAATSAVTSPTTWFADGTMAPLQTLRGPVHAIFMHEGTTAPVQPTRALYEDIATALKMLKSAGVRHCDIRRRHNLLYFRCSSSYQLIDFDLSAGPGDKVFLTLGTDQCRAAPYCVRRQLQEQLERCGDHCDDQTYEVEWDHADDLAMFSEYLFEKLGFI
jgi:hypothetical protein